MRTERGTAKVRLEPPREEADRVRLEGRLEMPGGNSHELFFEFTRPDGGKARPNARPFLLAFLLPAMRAGVPLELEQPVDPVTVANLMEWQTGFAAWRPDRLRCVPVLAPATTAADTGLRLGSGALTAFSGGVDSCFTVHEQTRSPQPDTGRRIALAAGLMVHGFDVPLDQDDVFERAYGNSSALLGAFGLESYRLRTNVRALQGRFGCEWGPEAHGIWLGAALTCLEPWFDALVIPSTYTYARMKFPWGSNPISDPLLGSARVPCFHDGAGHTKLTKVKAIAAHPAVAARVRVCWEGDQRDRNCGHCFKCIATQICFWLAGVEQPAAFPSRCTLAEVAALAVRDEMNDFLLATMETEARARSRKDLAAALEQARARGICPPPRRRRWKSIQRLWAQLHPR